MLPLLRKTGHPVLDAVLGQPFTYSRDYARMPNYVRSIPVAAGPPGPLPDIVIQELGLVPKLQKLSPTWPHLPDIFIHEFSNVLLYNGLPFDDGGNLIYDAIKKIHYDGRINGFLGGSPTNKMRPLMINTRYHVFEKYFNEAPVRLDGEYIFSEIHSGFGSRLLMTITQLWVFKFFPAARMLLAPEKNDFPRYFRDWVKPYQLEGKNFFSPPRACILEKLYVPTRSYMFAHYVTPTAMEVFKKIRDFYARPVKAPREKLFLSRKNIENRKLVNEDDCEKIFRANGFQVVNMEELTIEEQILKIYNATHVAGPMGSAMHNMAFCHDQAPETLILSPRKFPHWYVFGVFESAYKRKCNVVYGPSSNQPGINHEKEPWVMDMKNLKRAVRQWLKG